jgi:hypothetical protein
MSPRAVRFRIERGELEGVKVGQAWQVVWEGVSAGGSAASASGNGMDVESHLISGIGSDASAGGSQISAGGRERKRFPFRGNGKGRFATAGGNNATAGGNGISPGGNAATAGGNGAEAETGKATYAKELSQLAAFRILKSVYTALPATPEAASHREALHAALREVTRGYYQWRKDAKLSCYNAARNRVADTILELILIPLADADLAVRLVRELEHEALAALIGLSRRFEGKKGDLIGE